MGGTDALQNLPWHQYALIVELAHKMKTKKQFGKTALQKLTYILQDILGVPCGYDFAVYTHGPFCSDLLVALDYTAYLGGVRIDDESVCVGYNIKPGPKASSILNRGKDFLAQHADKINQIVTRFGDYTARELELISTLLYIHREKTSILNRDALVDEACQTRPFCRRQEVEDALRSLENDGYISWSAPTGNP